MATIDATNGEVAPVKKSLRSKRLMRPAKSKGRKASDTDAQPETLELKEHTDGESAASKMGSEQGDKRGSAGAVQGEAWDSGTVDDTDRHSGTTDVETLAAGNRGSTYSNERQSLMNGLPSVDKSESSGTTYTSSSTDVFVEASESPRVKPQRGSFGVLEPQFSAESEQHQQLTADPEQHDRPASPPVQDIIDLTSPADDAKSRASRGDSSGQQFMDMLGDLQSAEEPQSYTRASVDEQQRGSDAYDTGFMDSLVDSYGQAASQDDVKAASEAHDYTQALDGSVQPPAAEAPASAEASPAGDAGSKDVEEDVASVKVSELETEHAKLGDRTSEAGSGVREYGLGRSSSMRNGLRSTRGPEERRRPSEAVVSPVSGGSVSSKKGNRRSIMLTSFVPPVGMSGGGGGSSNASRSSTEKSPAGSISEAMVDHSAMNGVVEISAGGRTFKRSSILDSQLSSSRRSSNRISQDMAMSSIRLRPSADVVSAGTAPPSDVKSVAKTALQSISERIGSAVGSSAPPANSAEEDEEEDDGMPEWMKEVQRRKREARKQEEAARAARAALEAEEAEEAARAEAEAAARIEAAKAKANAEAEASKVESAKVEEQQAMATPVSIRSYDAREAAHTFEPASEHERPVAASAASIGTPLTIKATDVEHDDDDMPLTDIDLNTDKPLPALGAGAPAAVQASTPPQPPVTTRSIYRSLSASLGISQATQEPENPARQSGPPMPTLAERQRATSQTDSPPTPSQNGLFAAVTSFFGRASTQLSAPPSASASVTTAPVPPAMMSQASSSSNLSRGTIEFPGMRPSGTEARANDNGDPMVDMLLNQLEAQNQQIMKDNKARVFAQTEAVERDDEDNVDWDFWGNLINNYDGVTRSEPRKLARSVYRGIPKAVRGTVWQLMAKSRSDPALGERFRRLVALRTEPDSDGARHEKQIRHDLARTFPKLDYFRDADGAGQEGLFNVLRAYALFDPEVGYCQGLSFVVGPLLLNMPDEEAFCVLVKLMYTYGLRGHFLPTMDDLQLRLYQFEHVLADMLPWLSRHFQEQGVLPTMYVSQWLMTMFAYRLPIELTFRLFDVMFAEGLDCLLRVAIAVLKRSQTRLLTLEFEAILQYLNDGPLFAFYSHASPDMLVRDANQMSINARLLQKLRRQYIEEAQRKLEEEDEAHRMRAENEQLKHECAQLRSTLQELSSKQGSIDGSRQSLQQDLDKQRDESSRLALKIDELEERLKNERAVAEAQLKSDMDKLAQKNVQLTIKNQQLDDSLQDMEEALIQIKMLYAESENQRELTTKRLDDLRKALS